MNWNFTLRQGVTFSNGDPFNAYVMWYSLYRTLIVNQAPSFILGQNFGVNTPGANISDVRLNSMNYTAPSASNLTLMQTPRQSFQVINQNEIVLHLGYGYNGNVSYSALLATLTAPSSFAVDPKVVHANGGVCKYKEFLDADQCAGYRILSPELLGSRAEYQTGKEHELLGWQCNILSVKLCNPACDFE
jgi:hypothetical protein